MMSFWRAVARAVVMFARTGGEVVAYGAVRLTGRSDAWGMSQPWLRGVRADAGVDESASCNTDQTWAVWDGSDKKSVRACHEMVFAGVDEVKSRDTGPAWAESDKPDTDLLFLFCPPGD